VQQGILFAIEKVIQGVSRILARMKAEWMHESRAAICMAAFNMLFFTCQKEWETVRS
jgi:hypothetical protein